MISRKDFKHVMNEIITVNDRLDKLQAVNSEFALSIVENYSLQDELITLLEKLMNIPVDAQFGSTISWWIYETEFGKNNPYIYIDNKGTEIKYVLDSVDKLYDFCIEESKERRK